jgi:hypothetical protein
MTPVFPSSDSSIHSWSLVYFLTCAIIISISRYPEVLKMMCSPIWEDEKARAWKASGRHVAALLLDLAVKRAATGRRDRAIDAILV